MLFLCYQAQDLKVFECVFGLLMGYLVIVLLINVCSVFAKPVTKQGTNLITAIVGSRAKLPCNFPKLEPHDRVRLILWYREDIGTPIYSVDARDANFSMAGHWSEEKLFGRRASFQADNVSAALVVNGVRKEDEGFFRCRTDFLHAQTRNLFTQLQVVVPPRKVWLTRSDGAILSSVLEGLREEERLDLTCHAEGGDPSPRLLWLEDNKPIDAVEEITSGDIRKLRLRINALQRHHSGVLLTCEASNSNLIQPVTASVKLGLYLRPIEVKIDDTTKHLSAGVEANLVCRAYGARPPPLFTWWMDNVLKEELGVETSSQNETVSSIRFTPQITDRGKLIKCSVRQRNETILDPEDRMSIEYQLETTRLLFIYYKPIVTLRLGASLTSRQIKEGDDIYFDCIIDAVPLSYKILWFHNEQELHHNVSFGRIISNYSLALQKIERKMSGKYVCLAANSEGQTVSNAVVLDVLYSPVCKIKFTKVYGVGRHEEISILCEVESSPKDIKGFRWALNSTSNGKITEIPSVNYTIDGSTSTLKYVPSSDVEFGTALCWAKNIVGEQKIPCVFQIVAAERPDPVRNCTLSNQSTDSLSFQCLEGFSGGLEQHFLLKVLASNGTVLRDNISSSTAAFSIRGLNPDSMFLLSVQAVNPKGRSDAVVSKVFTLRPPETQKNTEANSKSSKSGDFLTENSPLIGAITGAVLCLLLLTAPIVLAFLRSIRSRRLERERYPLETISGATFVHCQVRDKPDVVPQKGNLRGKINVKSFHHFHTPTESDILCKESTGSYGIIKSSMRKNIASTIMEGQLGDKSSCSKTKSYLDILTEANYDYQKHESEV